MDEFYQVGPTLKNQFTTDRILQNYMTAYLPNELREEIRPDLKRFGERVATDILALGALAEGHPPQLVSFDPWGRPQHHIEVHQAWSQLDSISAEEGLISIGYQRKLGEYSRLHQYLKLFLFHPSSAYYSCPLAMTDGAAKLIETFGESKLKDHALTHLTSNDPKEFWTSGQWMTERAGGSDVSRSETEARPLGSGDFALYGTKWFTSATTSQMAMTLAREPDQKSLSLFYLELRDADNRLNQIEVLRLKDKMGTKALPTAELRLTGTRSRRVGKPGQGVKSIASLFNVTRIHNSVAATSSAKRILTLLINYSEKRIAFGAPIIEKPLHIATLSNLVSDYLGCFLIMSQSALLLGREECAQDATAENARQVLRILTPLSKLFTAKINMQITSESIEGFGGAGYVEDVGVAKFLRDSQVLTIWEGTTNVLSLDVLRAIHKENALPYFLEDIQKRVSSCDDASLKVLTEHIEEELQTINTYSGVFLKLDLETQEMLARRYSFNLARVYIKSLLLDFTYRTKSLEYKASLTRWIQNHKIENLDDMSADENKSILSGF